MGKTQNLLSHAEVWDDSALQKSWDDALTEYKLYHSIHARGERVEDVLREAEKSIEAETEVVNKASVPLKTSGLSREDTNGPAQELEDGELEDGEMIDSFEKQMQHSNVGISTPTAVGVSTTANLTGIQAPSSSQLPVAHKPHETNHTAAHTVTSKVKDEGLKNLMLSWYYAGYYTGLYEGQRQSGDKAA